jgi:REP element-mobilizing transposase RayT
MLARVNTASFLARWSQSGAAERANYQLFLSELCDVLGVPRPDPAKPDDAENAYVFERAVTFQHPDGSTSSGRIDLYKRACFILEAKQGVEKRESAEMLAEATKAAAKATKKGTARRGSAAWDEAMLKARSQAEQYARALPASEGRPPLLIVVDVGHSIELYSEFTSTGGTYVPFPDPLNHRILLAQLDDPGVRETLRLAWTDPLALDPSRRSARVTHAIAQSLGRLAASLEKSSHNAEVVAAFLMRALFTMFAEDVGLLPKDGFSALLKSLRGNTTHFVPMVGELWSRMKTGGFSTALRENIRHFNGGLFENADALPLNDDQFELLIEASRADWRDVEPSIFGTLLARALDPVERHKLGAHYTPRTYVERLVLPTVIAPLRAEWDAVRAAALTLDRQGKAGEAIAEVQQFHRRLCAIRVLDPACGTGNFLYVTFEHLKRLEGEVLDALARLGHEQAALEMSGFTVDPHQLLGIEVNPRAAAIAELVLWIGYLQWHFRTAGRVAPPEPIIKNFHNIECRDAVLACDHTEPLLDENGQPVTRWDGRTMKKHPATGEDVPDESARVPLLRYIGPRPADWPEADFIVGNPPFIGTARMREALGDGYAETLRKTYPAVPESADFVMFWWHKAALLVREGKAERFGFITTNSLRQTFNRRVLESHLNPKDHEPKDRGLPARTESTPTDRGLPVRIEEKCGLKAHRPLPADDAPSPFFNPHTETDISEHKLPHWNQADCFCFVTWRMDDALPRPLVEEWKRDRDLWTKDHPEPWDSETQQEYHELFSVRLNEWLDAGHGSCVLRQPEIRKIVADALGHFDGTRYHLASYVIMPNHVHVLLRLIPGSLLPDILHSWKSFTANAVNKALNRTGTLWQPEYWDTLIRSERHLAACLAYIRDNPAHLAAESFTLWAKDPKDPKDRGLPARSLLLCGQDAHGPLGPFSSTPLSLTFAIPDHPWVDSADGAAVRIAMTVACVGQHEGKLARVTGETPGGESEFAVELAEERGVIHADLTVGADVSGAVALRANEGLSNHGVITGGEGFIITREQAFEFGLGKDLALGRVLKPILNGKDLAARSRDAFVIDLFGMSAEEVRNRFPQVYQWVLTHVKPVRDQNNRESRRLNWWLFNENVPKLRNMLLGLKRFISTIETAKHRFFVFLDEDILPAHKLVNIALDDAYFLGVLSSRIHVTWALATGSRLGVGNDPVYVKSASFEKFPFPDASEPQRSRIRELAEALDAHRKRQQAQHPKITLTDIYNVMEKLRDGTPLSAKEQLTHENGLGTVLLQIHDDLDAAVAEAYGLPQRTVGFQPAPNKQSGQDAHGPLAAAAILAHLCALNVRRAAEEANGQIRWLRPEFLSQGTAGFQPASNKQSGLEAHGPFECGQEAHAPVQEAHAPVQDAHGPLTPWPKSLADQARAIRSALVGRTTPATVGDLAATFKGANRERIAELLETLESLGQARSLPDGTFLAG